MKASKRPKPAPAPTLTHVFSFDDVEWGEIENALYVEEGSDPHVFYLARVPTTQDEDAPKGARPVTVEGALDWFVHCYPFGMGMSGMPVALCKAAADELRAARSKAKG